MYHQQAIKRGSTNALKSGVDEISVDEIGVDEMAVGEIAVDEPGIIRSKDPGKWNHSQNV